MNAYGCETRDSCPGRLKFPPHLTTLQGLSLIEVMVTLIVLSMSLLGLVMLQGLGVQYANKAYLRTQAMLQAYNITEHMRANKRAADTGDYTNGQIPAHLNKDCIRDICSTGELARYHLVHWNTHNAALLPEGAGTITREGGLFIVQINWREPGHTDGPDEIKSLELSARL